MSAEEVPPITLPSFRIKREGEWFHEDNEITHPGLLANLQGNLQRDAGGYYIQAGQFRLTVTVEDTPFTVVRIEPAGEELRITLNDGSQEVLDPLTLRLTDGEVPYCRVKAGRFDARLIRAAAYQLLRLLEYDEGTTRAMLVVGAARYPLEPGR